MNALSFCLYGANPKYLEGMLANAWLVPRVYPGWECHCWFENTVPSDYIVKLADLGVRLHLMGGGWKQRMFYRLLVHDLPNVSRYLIRDADSRISPREARCVAEWERSEALLHTIHDHPYHIRPIQGGMFGVWRERCQLGRTMQSLVADWPSTDQWGRDEEFLSDVLWPLLKHSFCEHGHRRIIASADSDEDPAAFIGEIYDAQGRPAHPEHRAMRRVK